MSPTLTLRFLTPLLGLSNYTQHDRDLLVDMPESPAPASVVPEAGTQSLHNHTLVPGAGEEQRSHLVGRMERHFKEPLIFYYPTFR